MLKKLLVIPALLALLHVGAPAHAQDTCGEVCTREFWDTATQAEIEAALRDVGVNARDERGRTPLHWASSRGTPEDIVTLLEAGADVNARKEGGTTPLHSAALLGTPENVTTLMEAGADINARDGYGWTPLHAAALVGTEQHVLTLLEAGADGTAENDYGETPFDLAQDNEDLRGTDAYWALNDARFR